MDYEGKTGGGYNRFQNSQKTVPQRDNSDISTALNNLSYQSSWITGKADKALVEFAEKAGKYMADEGLKSSKIRSIYGEIKRIQMKTFEKDKASFFLLKPKVAYALGRDKNVKGLQLFKYIFDKCFDDVTNETQYQNFCNLIEAILAYHKAYVKNDR